MLRYCVIVKLVVKSYVLFCNCAIFINSTKRASAPPYTIHDHLNLQNAYDFMGLGKGSFPVAERAGERVMSLPNYPEMTDAMPKFVVKKVKELI